MARLLAADRAKRDWRYTVTHAKPGNLSGQSATRRRFALTGHCAEEGGIDMANWRQRLSADRHMCTNRATELLDGTCLFAVL
jgi:hypothetical protein